MRTFVVWLKNLFRRLGYAVVRNSTLELYERNARAGQDIDFLRALPDVAVISALQYLRLSRSQIRQDLFVLSQLSFKRGGFFVEFGATNGVDLSNSYLLEKEFGWKGILAEPARGWHADLKTNRSAAIETRCVWKLSGQQLSFNEVTDRELSTIQEFVRSDLHSNLRASSKSYSVETISLTDLLIENNAPKVIDYLSIDTEGSEFEILNAFDFDQFEFKVITCEHNYSYNREKVYNLLTRHGYRRCFESLSQFDDWYIKT